MAFHSDYQNYLLDRREVASLLANTGFPLKGLGQSGGEDSVQDSTPQWMRIYAAKSALRVYEAAWIMNRTEPPGTYPKNYPSNTNQYRALSAIIDSVELGDIETKNTNFHLDDDPKTWLLEHQSVIDWCKRAGYEWPLSGFMRPAQTEDVVAVTSTQHVSQQDQDKLKRELVALRQEVADLRSTVEDLKRSVPLHPVRHMAKAIEVQHKYWQDPNDNRPKSAVIVAEMRAQYPELSDANAKAIEQVACPIDRNK